MYFCDYCDFYRVVNDMRLIDADELMERYNLKDATKYGNKDAEQQMHSYSTLMLYEIADMIDDAPTVEAVPVVRGEWMTFYNRIDNTIGVCCSVCGIQSVIEKHMLLGNAEAVFNNFCPRCGADMRGKKNE